VANLEGKNIAFTGPVYGYYEYTATNFLRLTDDEWRDTYLAQAARPQWTNLYLTDNTGQKKDNIVKLFTSAPENQTQPSPISKSYLIIANYPNPFNAETIIQYTIPGQLGNRQTVLTVHDIQGRVVKRLINGILSPGNYRTRWDGCNAQGESVSSGIFFYHLQVGSHLKSGKMVLLR
jgi:flagellar hook assembly protein FlgD